MELNVLFILALSIITIDAQYLGQLYGQQPQKDRYQVQQQKEALPPIRQYIPEQSKSFPAILSHKQGLTSDGKFNYAFATDHGLQQGETINPDGSRTGAYSYVDPSGKKISVKYTAGKDGFKVLEGDHIPKAPAPAAAAAAPVQQEPYSVRPASYENADALYPRYTAGSFLGSGTSGSSSSGGGSGPSAYYKSNFSPASSFSPAPVSFRGTQNDLGGGYNSFANQKYGSSGLGSASAATPYYNVQEDSGESSSGSKNYFPSAGIKQQYSSSESEYDDGAEGLGPKKPHTFGNGYAFAFEG